MSQYKLTDRLKSANNDMREAFSVMPNLRRYLAQNEAENQIEAQIKTQDSDLAWLIDAFKAAESKALAPDKAAGLISRICETAFDSDTITRGTALIVISVLWEKMCDKVGNPYIEFMVKSLVTIFGLGDHENGKIAVTIFLDSIAGMRVVSEFESNFGA